MRIPPEIYKEPLASRFKYSPVLFITSYVSRRSLSHCWLLVQSILFKGIIHQVAIMDYRKVLVLGISVIALLLLLFYLSPFSELNILECHTPNIPNPAGAQIEPTCGYIIYPQLPFPLKTRNSDFVEFCKRNVKTVEKACNASVDDVLLIAFQKSNATHSVQGVV